MSDGAWIARRVGKARVPWWLIGHRAVSVAPTRNGSFAPTLHADNLQTFPVNLRVFRLPALDDASEHFAAGLGRFWRNAVNPDGTLSSVRLTLESVKKEAGSRPLLLIERMPAVLATATLLGVILYGAVFFVHQQFYAQFGLTPEEVGLTYTALITRAAFSSGVLLVIALPTSFITSWILPADNSEPSTKKLSSKAPPRRRQMRRQRLVLLVVTVVLAVITLVGVSWLTVDATKRANAVKAGHPLRYNPLSLLAIKTVPVQASWLDTDLRSTRPKIDRLIYLGASEGELVLYDPASSSVLRVPADKVALTTR